MIHVLIPNWNNEAWILRCLESVRNQNGIADKEVQALVIDDASTDGSWEIIRNFCGSNFYFGCYRNEENKKCPRNLWEGIQHMQPHPEDVIYLLDGDDFLPHDRVLQRIKELFSNPDLWLTYGNYDVHPHNTGQVPATDYPTNIKMTRGYRPSMRQLFNHPLVFRAHLWNELEEIDMKDGTGEWFDIGYDKVIMLPLLELATPYFGVEKIHWRFIDEILYTYNSVNPQSDIFKPHGADLIEVWHRSIREPHVWPP